MSSVRVQKIFEGATDQLKRLGQYSGDSRSMLRWQGRATDGKDAALYDADSATWATGNKRAIVTAEAASDANSTAAMKTQSHASGQSLDGSVRFYCYVETPASWTSAHAAWLRNLEHHLRGQLSAPVQFRFTANGTEPTVDGVNGAGSTAANTSAGWDLPYGGGSAYPGGV
jgi:hypothetical protein